MSVATNLFARTAVETPVRRRAVLTVVQVGETSAPRAPFAAAVVALLVCGLIGLLVLNTVLAKDAFKLHALQVEGRQLADTEQVLTREVESLRAPAALAEKAVAMGMVQAGPPSFLRLPDGAVHGSAQPAPAPVVEGEPVPEPQAQAAPEPVADEDDAADPGSGAEEETPEDG